ncbi:MAG: NADH-quinone oxidoreductase subunit A [Nannocystaceae bacterium]
MGVVTPVVTSPMDQWIPAFIFLALSAFVGAGMLVAARVLGVRSQRAEPLKATTYECGEEPEGTAWLRFHPRYYVVALVFVIFDVEAAFLFPWALSIEAVGGLAIVDMTIFVAILMLGWAYAIRKGALKWQ